MEKSGVTIPLTRVPRKQTPNTLNSSSDVSLSNANEFAYLLPVSIGSQQFMVLFDTGSSDLWVVSSNCTTSDCQKIPTFNLTDTGGLSLSDTEFHLKYLLGSVTGEIGTDTVTLGSYEISSQVLALANNTSGLDLSGTGYSGILGLAFPALASIPDSSGQTLVQNVFATLNDSDRFFAFNLGRNQTSSSFTIGQLDPAFINSSSKFSYTPVSNAGTENNSYNYWKLPLQSFTINSTTFELSKSKLKGASNPIAVLDTGTTLILGPSADVERFWNSVGGARNTNAGWQVRCNRAIVVGFVLGNSTDAKEYVIDPADISWEEGGRQDNWCMGGIQANNGVSSGDWLLGDTFLRNVYAMHHAASGPRPPQIGLLGITDAAQALRQFQLDRGYDPSPPAQVQMYPRATHQLTGGDICGIAVCCGFVFGFILTVLVHLCIMPRLTRSHKF